MPLCQVLPHRETTCISCKRKADLKNKTEDTKAYIKIQDGKTKRPKRNKRNHRNNQNTSDLLSHLRLLNIKAISRYFIFTHYESS